MVWDPKYATAGGFVEPRGMIRSVVGSVIAQEFVDVAGANVDPDASPLRKGQIAFLAVFPDELVLFKAKRGAFKPSPTSEVYAAAPRSAVGGASVQRGKIAGVLHIDFTDGSSWAFDVPRVHLSGADAVAAGLVQR